MTLAREQQIRERADAATPDMPNRWTVDYAIDPPRVRVALFRPRGRPAMRNDTDTVREVWDDPWFRVDVEDALNRIEALLTAYQEVAEAAAARPRYTGATLTRALNRLDALLAEQKQGGDAQ